MSKPTVKFRCSINNDVYEEVLSYNQILEYLAKDDNDIVWNFKDINSIKVFFKDLQRLQGISVQFDHLVGEWRDIH